MPTSPLRRAPRDASAKRRRSWVQRASEAPDGQTTTYPGTMPVALNRDCAQLLVLRHIWKSGGADMLPCVTTLK